MAEDTDFSSLYRELGITHACTFDEFRSAYRRRVAQLHPDQRGGESDVARLQELNRMHDAAVRFMQAHGRLPGARRTSAATPGPDAGDVHEVGSVRVEPRHSASEESDDGKAGIGRSSRYFVWIAVVTIVASVWHLLDRPRNAGPAATTPSEGTAVDVANDGMISLGMGKAQVRAIEGAPLGSHDIRWDYGPSWIDFRCGDVVTDWYSSPMRPLSVPTPHPTTKDWDRFDAKPVPGC